MGELVMEKLEKVIAGLSCCNEPNNTCDECPYDGQRDDDKACLDLMQEDALRILKMWDVIHKDIWDRTHEIVRLKKELKVARAERDAAREKLARITGEREAAWLSENGEYVPEAPRDGM